uniref:Uncharacterized protein n=1 Tax=Vespula pensylvanica TaxID=30213 RepID=A0A834NS48_VESPE|nr:hypothetical protein H0235_011438 [Vespula pensylvanica]
MHRYNLSVFLDTRRSLLLKFAIKDGGKILCSIKSILKVSWTATQWHFQSQRLELLSMSKVILFSSISSRTARSELQKSCSDIRIAANNKILAT